MLPQNVTSSLDNLSRLGILNYDAAADIAGSRPRYYGNLQAPISPNVYTPMDNFSYSNPYDYGVNTGSVISRPLLGWISKGAVLLGSLYLGGKGLLLVGKGLKSIKNPLPKLFKQGEKAVKTGKKEFRKGKKNVKKEVDNIISQSSSKTDKVKNFFKDGWNNTKKIFKRRKIKLT